MSELAKKLVEKLGPVGDFLKSADTPRKELINKLIDQIDVQKAATGQPDPMFQEYAEQGLDSALPDTAQLVPGLGNAAKVAKIFGKVKKPMTAAEVLQKTPWGHIPVKQTAQEATEAAIKKVNMENAAKRLDKAGVLDAVKSAQPVVDTTSGRINYMLPKKPSK